MGLAQVGARTYFNSALTATKVAALGATTNAGYLLFNFTCFNSHATDVVYIQFFDAASADVTVGTTTPKFVLPLPPVGGIDGGLMCPREFRTAVTIAATSTATGSGSPAANALVSFDYVSG